MDVAKIPTDLLNGLAFGRFTVADTVRVIDAVGHVNVDIGDSLTLLHQAAQYDLADVANYLLENGHDVDPRTINGETPLDQAAWRGCVDVAVILLNKGANIDNQTNDGYTPLARCAFYGYKRLLSLLSLLGADPSLKDKDGKTGYDHAIEQGHDELAPPLKPMYSEDGKLINEYANKNPRHPDHNPEELRQLLAYLVREQRKAATLAALMKQ